MSANEFLSAACAVAREAGEILSAGFGSAGQIEFKGTVDLVTKYDHESEAHILGRLRDLYPQHAIRAEESGLAVSREESPFEWLGDPLDGTTNFAHGFPFFAVSIALLEAGRPIVAAVFDPVRDELFAAIVGASATLNGAPIRVSGTDQLDRALLATGFPYDVRTHPRNNMTEFNRMALRTQGIRRAGAAALDLCYTACGRLDGFWELRLHPWDVAAGGLIVQAAGGKVTDIENGDEWLSGISVVASNGRVHTELLATLPAESDKKSAP